MAHPKSGETHSSIKLSHSLPCHTRQFLICVNVLSSSHPLKRPLPLHEIVWTTFPLFNLLWYPRTHVSNHTERLTCKTKLSLWGHVSNVSSVTVSCSYLNLLSSVYFHLLIYSLGLSYKVPGGQECVPGTLLPLYPVGTLPATSLHTSLLLLQGLQQHLHIYYTNKGCIDTCFGDQNVWSTEQVCARGTLASCPTAWAPANSSRRTGVPTGSKHLESRKLCNYLRSLLLLSVSRDILATTSLREQRHVLK